MAASTDVGLALLQGGVLLALNALIRGYCAHRLDLEVVPAILRGRVRMCNRLTPTMLFVAGAMIASSALVFALPG
jgi:hypothetical protein